MRPKLVCSELGDRAARGAGHHLWVLVILATFAQAGCLPQGPPLTPRLTSAKPEGDVVGRTPSPPRVTVGALSPPSTPTASPTARATLVRPSAVISAENASQLVELGVMGIEADAGGIWTLALSPDATLLAVGDGNGFVRLFRTSDGVQLWAVQADTEKVTDVAFVRGEDTLVSAAPWHAKTWSLADGSLVQSLDFPASGRQSPVVRGTLSEDGQTLAMAIGWTIEIWDVPSATQLRTFSAAWNHVYWMVFSPDVSRLGVLSVDAGFQGMGVDVFRLTDGVNLGSTEEACNGFAFSSDSRILFCNAGDGIRAWLLPQNTWGSLLQVAQGAAVEGMGVSPKADLLAAGTWDGEVLIWDLRDGDQVASIDSSAARITQVEFSSDGTLVALASDDGTVRLWGIR